MGVRNVASSFCSDSISSIRWRCDLTIRSMRSPTCFWRVESPEIISSRSDIRISRSCSMSMRRRSANFSLVCRNLSACASLRPNWRRAIWPMRSRTWPSSAARFCIAESGRGWPAALPLRPGRFGLPCAPATLVEATNSAVSTIRFVIDCSYPVLGFVPA